MKKIYKNEWVEKYARETWTMPFGSIMNAYAQNIQGKDKPIKSILADIRKIYEMSQELIDLSLKEGEPIDLDKAEKLGEEWKKNFLENERLENAAKYQEKVDEANEGEKLPIIEEK